MQIRGLIIFIYLFIFNTYRSPHEQTKDTILDELPYQQERREPLKRLRVGTIKYVLDSLEEDDRHGVVDHALAEHHTEELGVLVRADERDGGHRIRCAYGGGLQQDLLDAQLHKRALGCSDLHDALIDIYWVGTCFVESNRERDCDDIIDERTHETEQHYVLEVMEELLLLQVVRTCEYNEWKQQFEKRIWVEAELKSISR